MLRLIKTDKLKNKTTRRLVFEICSLREEQAGRFERINLRLKKQQKKIDFEKIRKRIERLNDKDFEKGKEKIEKPYLRNRAELFKAASLELEEKQRRKREVKFGKIRRKLEKKGYFKELELKITERRKKLRGRSKCTFSVLYEYVEEYKKAKKK